MHLVIDGRAEEEPAIRDGNMDCVVELDALHYDAALEGLAIVASERYARADQSVTGQTLKLLAAKPDVVLVAGVGGPGVLP